MRIKQQERGTFCGPREGIGPRKRIRNGKKNKSNTNKKVTYTAEVKSRPSSNLSSKNIEKLKFTKKSINIMN